MAMTINYQKEADGVLYYPEVDDNRPIIVIFRGVVYSIIPSLRGVGEGGSLTLPTGLAEKVNNSVLIKKLRYREKFRFSDDAAKHEFQGT